MSSLSTETLHGALGRPPRVVRLLARLNMGGPARHVTWLTAGLREAGFESILVTGTVPPGEEDMSYFAHNAGIDPIVIPELSRDLSWRDAITIWKLYRLFVKLQPDIIHTHTAKAGAAGRIAAILYRWLRPQLLWKGPRRCPVVHTFHGHVFHSYFGLLKTRFFLMVEKLLARLATDRIIAVSQRQYEEIHGTFGVGRSRQFAVIPLGLDLDTYHNSESRRHILRDELGASPDEILVGIVGRLTEIKNHSTFLFAASMFLKTWATGGKRRVRFVIIGDGSLRASLERQAEDLGLKHDVVFLGRRDDPENFYPGLDILSLTSLNEGTPLTILEAMANGRPAVSADVGGVADLLGPPTDGTYAFGLCTPCQRGVLVDQCSPYASSDALAWLCENPEQRRIYGERGRKFVQEHYSRDRLVRDIAALYCDLLTTAGRQPSRLPVSQSLRLNKQTTAN